MSAQDIITQLYWYCTDFCVNAANLLGVSYVSFNVLLFIVGLPTVILLLILANILQWANRSKDA